MFWHCADQPNFHKHDICTLRSLLPSAVLSPPANSLVSSGLRYCSSLLTGINEGNLHNLQMVQNSFARTITKTLKTWHFQPTFNLLAAQRARNSFQSWPTVLLTVSSFGLHMSHHMEEYDGTCDGLLCPTCGAGVGNNYKDYNKRTAHCISSSIYNKQPQQYYYSLLTVYTRA